MPVLDIILSQRLILHNIFIDAYITHVLKSAKSKTYNLMTEEKKYPGILESSKGIKKSKFPVDIEAEKRFDAIKRKYANAIAYLLANNIPRIGLNEYFQATPENRKRFDTIKKIRAEVIAARAKARLWIDKPFYVKLDLGEVTLNEQGDLHVPIVLGECVFKKTTNVVSDKKSLEQYMETIAKIIEAEKVWADPDMEAFDLGEREYLSETAVKKPKEVTSETPL